MSSTNNEVNKLDKDIRKKKTDVDLPLPENIGFMRTMKPKINILQEDVVVIPQPTECYLNSSKKIDFSQKSNNTILTSIHDDIQTVTFNMYVLKGQVPDTWSDWGIPPYVESETPAVLIDFDNNLEMTLSVSSKLFGFELTPGVYTYSTYTVEFYSDTTLVSSITQGFMGYNSALLYAVWSELPITRVVIHGGPNDGFAIAQIRYGQECPCCAQTNENIIPFTTTITTPFNIKHIGIPELRGYNIDITCQNETCHLPAEITLPDDSKLYCSDEVDKVIYTGSAKLLITIPAKLSLDCPESVKVVLNADADININQIYYKCLGQGDCSDCDCHLLTLEHIEAVLTSQTEVVISGTIRFNNLS